MQISRDIVVSKYIKNPIVVLWVGFILLLTRAWPRLFYPEVWDEDGSRNIPDFLLHGVSYIFEPVNGYLILVPKLITLLSVSISISQYPLISTLIAWGVILAVFYLIATTQIKLSGGILLAIAGLLIPSDPEVFGLPIYTFWWVSLLLFIIIFWDKQSVAWVGRALIIFFASLSSPVCVVVLPLIWIRAFLLRKHQMEIGLAAFASFCVSVQTWMMWHYPDLVASNVGNINFEVLVQVISKFFGAYLIGNLHTSWQLQWGIVLSAFFVISLCRNRRLWVLWALFYLWGVAVLMSMSRVNVEIIHPALAGPRYFFYPFILQSWFLLQIGFVDSSRWVRGSAWLFLLLSVMNALPVLYRKHESLNWQAHLNSCLQFDHYNLPVHFDGSVDLAWSFLLTRQNCAELLALDPFYSLGGIQSFPYQIIRKSSMGIIRRVPGIDRVVKNEWTGQDYYSTVTGSSTLPGLKVIGSFHSANADASEGELILHLYRNDQIWFRSQINAHKQKIIIVGSNGQYLDALPASSEWVLLRFSNSSLPDEFDVKFIDGGDGWGEWSAIALRKNKNVN